LLALVREEQDGAARALAEAQHALDRAQAAAGALQQSLLLLSELADWMGAAGPPEHG
jgi:hypothetical protein